MASNAISEITDEFLVCQICLEDFRQPKMLPCLHTFCQPCLERLLATQPVGKLNCPTCRQDVPLTENGVQGLNSNFLVGKLHDILQQQPRGKEDTDEPPAKRVPCTACKRGNPAEFYCVECTDYLCHMCNDTHRGLKMSKYHKVLTIQDLKSGQLATELRARQTSTCEDHNELNKFYCDTCHQVICLHCVVTSHKDHQYVEIEEAAEREKAKIKAKLLTVKETVNLHEKWIEELQSVKNDWPLQVQCTAYRRANLRSINTAREKQMEAAMEAAEMDLASARSCVQFTDNLLEYGSPPEVMAVAGELSARMEQTADKKVTERAELTKGFMNLNFDPPVTGDGHRIHVLDKQGRRARVIQVAGAAEKTTQGIAVDSLGRIIVTIGYQVFVLNPSGDVILKFEDKGQGQQQLSTSLRVTVNSSNQIIISDWDNHILKILDPAGRHLFTCGSQGRGPGQLNVPYCVTTDSEDNIIVADCGNSRVSLFSRDGKFVRHVLTREEHGLNYPTGLTLTNNDGHLVVSDRHSIKMFNM
ncbi:E3 ubiquitin-protein ligase TRIM56-like [Branchiostoma floridae x Branchiostoma japonicum]